MRSSKLVALGLASFLLACAGNAGKNGPKAGDGNAAVEEQDQSPVLGMDPDVRVGKLDNGLTYYIRKHAQPENRASLWLAVDAGSVLEDDDQKGLAHFVEHMAFNGTERFEKNTLIDFIERAGMDFGADLNAFTSFDETVYMLTVPTDDAKTVATGMDILEDWAGALTFDPDEVDKERGVVTEEWRLGRGASQRAFDKQWPIFLKDSKYADRKPIGEKDVLQNAPVATLQRFYDDWYRPDLMAVIVVGDVDPDAMEKEIAERFGDLEVAEGARERENVPVPLLEETRAAVVTDNEANMSMVQYAIKGPPTPIETEHDYRQKLVESAFTGMLAARFDEIRQKPDSPFAFAFGGVFEMGRAVDVFQLTAFAKPGQVEKTVDVLTTEVERVRRHGFLASEFERRKTDMLRDKERALKEKDKVDARAYTFEMVNHFLEGEAMPGRAVELELTKRFLPEITLEEVNALADEWTNRKDRVVMASGAARDVMPSEKDLLAIVDTATGRDITAYEEVAVADTLMAQAPAPGTITKEETIDEIGATVWTLSNGAKVVVKPTDFKNDEIQLRAISPGGSSLASNADFWSATSSDGIVSQAGMAEYDAATLRKMTAGKVARVSPTVGELEEGLWGSGSPEDLELLMQMIHLTFTAPRKDAEAFEAWKGSTSTFVKNRDLNPSAVFFDAFRAFVDSNHPRSKPMTMESLEKVDHDEAFAFFQDRFGDAGDFTFVFVGNVDVAQMKKLSATYLASLPSKGRKEKWKDVGKKHPGGTKKVEVVKGQDPKSSVRIMYHGNAKWTPEAEDDLKQVAEVLEIRLREVLREEMGGVYGAFSYGNFERRPKQRYSYSVGFGCAPENVDALKKAVYDEVAALKKDGIGDDYVSKLKELRRRRLETDLRENRFWVNEIVDALRYGDDPAQIVESKKKAIERVSGDVVKKAAKRYLGRNRVEGVLMPEAGVEEKADAKKADAKK